MSTIFFKTILVLSEKRRSSLQSLDSISGDKFWQKFQQVHLQGRFQGVNTYHIENSNGN